MGDVCWGSLDVVVSSGVSPEDVDALTDKLRVAIHSRWRTQQGAFLRQNRKRKIDGEVNQFDVAIVQTRDHVVTCNHVESEIRFLFPSCLDVPDE